MGKDSRLVAKTVVKVKEGRFEATITREYYDGEEERKAQVEALKVIQKIPSGRGKL